MLPCLLQSFHFGDHTIELEVPRAELLRAAGEQQGQATPYWARLWPAALALCAFLSAQPELIRGKKLLELAAGLGLPGLWAAHLAREVLVSDYAPDAVALLQSNIDRNSLENAAAQLIDWNDVPHGLDADVLLLSDINYEPAAFDVLYEVLCRFLQQGTVIVLSSPQRLMARPFIERLLPFSRHQTEIAVASDGATVYISVWVLGSTTGVTGI